LLSTDLTTYKPHIVTDSIVRRSHKRGK